MTPRFDQTKSARSDDELVEALARQDLSALEELYERYKRVGFSLAYRIVGERGAAEDVLQESFLSVWRQANSFRRERGTLRSWLLSVVHNRAIDRLRASARISRAASRRSWLSRFNRRLASAFRIENTCKPRNRCAGAMARYLCWMRYKQECTAPELFWPRTTLE